MKKTIKILVVILIIIAIAAIFFAKRARDAALLEEPVVVASVQPAPVETVSLDEVVEAEPLVVEEEVVDVDVVEEEPVVAEVEPLFVTEIDEEALRSSGLPVMIQFYSTSCVPCMSMMEDLRAFYSENYGTVKVVAVNIIENPEAAEGYPVMVVPTQLFFTASGEKYIPSQRIIASVGGFAQFTYTDTGELAYVVHQGVLTKTQMERIAREAAGL